MLSNKTNLVLDTLVYRRLKCFFLTQSMFPNPEIARVIPSHKHFKLFFLKAPYFGEKYFFFVTFFATSNIKILTEII